MMYWGNRAKTRETFQGGWTKSGDKYVRNADGTYTYSGRSDDMLKVSGIYVSPFEIEATLVQHPAVLEAAVVGVPDAEGLTKTKAFVVLKQGAEAPAIPRRVYGLVDDLRGRAEGIEFRHQVDKAATFFLQRELAPSDVILPPEVLAFTRSPCRMKRVKTVDGGRASHNLTMLGRRRGIHSKPHSEPGANSSCISTQMWAQRF